MRSNRLFGLAVTVVLFVSGCAFSDSTVKIDYTPPGSSPSTGSKTTVSVERFTDQRGVEPHVLANKGVQYRTSGRYLSEKEVSVVVADATKALLTSLGYTVLEDGADFELSADLLRFESNVLVGVWSGELEGMAQINLRVRKSGNNTVVWNELLTGTAKKTGLQIDCDDHRKEVADRTLADLMQKMADSASLRKVLEAKNPTD